MEQMIPWCSTEDNPSELPLGDIASTMKRIHFRVKQLRQSCLYLDNVMKANPYHESARPDSSHRHRPIGIGLRMLADIFAKLNNDTVVGSLPKAVKSMKITKIKQKRMAIIKTSKQPRMNKWKKGY